ncbi:MAG: ArnT family glycosyltransferase [Gemmataceae bacterium]
MKLWLALLVAGAVGLLVLARLPMPLLEPEEGRYAEIPRQMLVAGEIVVPVLGGEPYLDKPPLSYWLNMAAYRVFGISEWSARIVPCLAALAIVAVTLVWGSSIAGPRTGLCSAGVLLTCPDFLYRAPMLTPNGLLTLFVAAGWAAGHIAQQPRRSKWLWWSLSAIATALGVLTKGPVAAVFVWVPLWAYCFWRREKQQVRGNLLQIAIVLLVAAPWFIAVTTRHPEFLEYFFWKHHVERAITPFDHAQPLWYYVPRLLVGAAPWTVMVLIGLLRGRRPTSDAIFPLMVMAWAFFFLSLSGSKRPIYLLPVYPALAVAIGTSSRTESISIPAFLRGLEAIAACVALWLPGYHAEFSFRGLLQPIPVQIKKEWPIACYPHDWPSVGFQLQRSDLATFSRGQEAELASFLRQNEKTLVVLKAGATAKEFAAILPRDMKWNQCGDNQAAVIGTVTKKTKK